MTSNYSGAIFYRVGNQMLGIFDRNHHAEGTKRLGAARHGLSHLEFQLDPKDKETMFAKLKASGAHAYGDNFHDADGNLFHFNYASSEDLKRP